MCNPADAVKQTIDDRLTRYAAFATAHSVVLLASAAGLGPIGWTIAAVTSLGFLWAWGHYHADLAINPQVDELQRNRWRIALYLLPWSMTLYWFIYVRPRR